ncbi:MAG: GNAT family N-acetyltransferase [Rhodanobacteraceae bacterium]
MTPTGDAPALRFSPLESARFGLRVFRANVDAIDAPTLAAAIENEGVDVAIVRIPSRALASVVPLAALGFAPIVADTLVHYETSLEAWPQRDAGITLRSATRADADLVERMARAIFSGYTSHYHANPLFAPDSILDGYAEWATRHLEADDGSAAWIVEHDGVPVGFSCDRVESSSGIATGVLNGILPEARRRGFYGAMLQALLSRFVHLRMRRFAIATQVHNFPVQRTWIANGLMLKGAYNTVHVNAIRR